MGVEKQAPSAQPPTAARRAEPAAPAGAEFAFPVAASGVPMPVPAYAGLRSSDILSLQRLVGNRAVQRLLADRVHDGLQRESEPMSSSEPLSSNTSLRDLSRATEMRAGALIKAGRKQEALDLIVDEVGERLMPLLSRVYQSRFLYYPKLTQLNGVVKCMPKGDPACRQVVVAIGDSAFTHGVPALYSTMLHEYKHVEQWQANPAQFEVESEELLDETRNLSAVREFEAYAHKILTGTRTGIDANTMAGAGKKMWEEGWSRMSSIDRDLHRQDYEMCLQAVRLKTGNFSWDPSK